MRPKRLKGHSATYEYFNGVSVSPTCKCGWKGNPTPPILAKYTYQSHLDNVFSKLVNDDKDIAKAEGK
jgi:hypothetical protein